MKWIVHAWNGNERDSGELKTVANRADVLVIAARVVGEFDITVDQASNIEGKRRAGGDSWFSAVLTPDDWSGEYDDGWFFERNEGYLFVYENGAAPATERWEPVVHVNVPMNGEIESIEYEMQIPTVSYETPLDAIHACERASEVVTEHLEAIGDRAVAFIERELKSAIDTAELRRAETPAEKE